MLEHLLQIETRGIVLLGNFNPSIFHPTWFAAKKLIQESESETANIDVILNEISRFQLGDWLSVEVLRDRCEFKTSKKPYFPILKDLVIGVFNVLNETPITAVGINVVYEISLRDEKTYYSFGNTLSPLSFWNSDLSEARLNRLEIVSMKPDNQNVTKRVEISPANPDHRINYGVALNVNNHIPLGDKSNGSKAAQTIEEYFNPLADSSALLVNNLLSKVIIS